MISTDAIDAPPASRPRSAACSSRSAGRSRTGPPSRRPATNAEIAAELHLSVDAVKTHLRALFEKFELADAPQSSKRLALVQRALQTGLIAERDL